MSTYNQEKVRDLLKQQLGKGRIDSYIAKVADKEIKKSAEIADETGTPAKGVIFVRRIYGECDTILLNTADAEKYPYSDFYYFDPSGLVSRWFPGINIDDLKSLN